MEMYTEIPHIAYWLWLTTRTELGLTKQHRLLDLFKSPERIYYADPGQINKLVFLSETVRHSLVDKTMTQVWKLLKECQRQKIRLCALDDPHYPEHLRHIDLPPLVLYLQGQALDLNQQVAIAMAGTRSCSHYGQKMAAQLAGEITRQGGLVVTGVVPGCDYAAATAALRAGGPVVCVLAGGVDVPFDGNSPSLYRAVRENGLLVSEYPPGVHPKGDHFPVRNRILTGLCVGTLCVEGSHRSGTMKVANLALSQGRDLYVVPASADVPQGAGMITLLKQGATPVTCGREVLNAYRAQLPTRSARRSGVPTPAVAQLPQQPVSMPRSASMQQGSRVPSPETKLEKAVDNEEKLAYIDLDTQGDAFTQEERVILLALQKGPQTADGLIDSTQLPTRRVLSVLTMLTIRQLVTEENDGNYRAAVRVKPHGAQESAAGTPHPEQGR